LNRFIKLFSPGVWGAVLWCSLWGAGSQAEAMPGLPGAPVQAFSAKGMVKDVRAVGSREGQWVSSRPRVGSSETVKPAATSHRPT